MPYVFLLILAQGCDLYPQDEFRESYVVESYLIADEPLPQVRLSTTLPVEEEYTFAKAAVSDANVVMRLLDDEGSVERVYPYALQSRGIFIAEESVRVLPLRTYQLEITFPDNDDVIKAQTLVPGVFETVEVASDTVTYQSPEQITITTTRSNSGSDRQAYFIFTVQALNPSEMNLTPFYLDLFRDGDDELSDFEINSSGIINESNYDVNPDNTLTLRVPWLAIAFIGNNIITANAIDNNMYDFLRSQEIQTGGGPSTLPPGEIQNIIYNVEGGIGIFGSMATESNKVFVNRKQEQ